MIRPNQGYNVKGAVYLPDAVADSSHRILLLDSFYPIVTQSFTENTLSFTEIFW
jgi:hypothetical protein